MKENFEYILEQYIMIVCAAHIFSLGFVTITPLMALVDGHYVLSLILAIIIYPVTVLLLMDSSNKD